MRRQAHWWRQSSLMTFINGAAVRFTMGAFVLRVDNFALIVGSLAGLLLGVVGAIPPAIRAMRMPIAEGLKAVRGSLIQRRKE